MPCHDPSPEEWAKYVSEENRALSAKVDFLEASLCLTLNAFSKAIDETVPDIVLSNPYFDYTNAGLQPEALASWWHNHIKKDQFRKAQEALQQERERQRLLQEQLKQQALAKLSPEERSALGL